MWKSVFIAFFLVLLPTVSGARVLKAKGCIRETFRGPSDWKPLLFDRSKKDTVYSIAQDDGTACLRADSDDSASALVWGREFSPYKYPIVKWRWKVSNVYLKGNIRGKKYNDSPARLFIMFKYNPEKANFFRKLEYSLARKIYGQYPPASALCYIWASRRHKDGIRSSPSFGAIKYIVLEAGGKYVGKWREEEINILKDYRRAFGKMPPRTEADVAFMDDSDDTGESSTSWLSSLELLTKPSSPVKSQFHNLTVKKVSGP